MLEYSDCRFEEQFCDVGDRAVFVDKKSMGLLSALTILFPMTILHPGSNFDSAIRPGSAPSLEVPSERDVYRKAIE